MAQCFLRLSNLDPTLLARVGVYETRLWRQAAQTIWTLDAMRRPPTAPARPRFSKPVARYFWDWADESGTLIHSRSAITLTLRTIQGVIRARELWSSLVSKFKKRHPALKHGGYSSTAVLPGENPAEFEELHQALIAELAPTGALEEDIVADIARLVWRKQNLATFRRAEDVRATWF